MSKLDSIVETILIAIAYLIFSILILPVVLICLIMYLVGFWDRARGREKTTRRGDHWL